MTERKCCKIGCDKPAEYAIWSGWKQGCDDYTDACRGHVSDLLDDSVRFEIIKLEPQREARNELEAAFAAVHKESEVMPPETNADNRRDTTTSATSPGGAIAGASTRLPHKTIPLQVLVDVDEGIATMVAYLNTIPGVRTHTSCQGTIGEGGAHPYRAQVMVTWNDNAAWNRLKQEFDVDDEVNPDNGYSYCYLHPREGWVAPGRSPDEAEYSMVSASIATYLVERHRFLEQERDDGWDYPPGASERAHQAGVRAAIAAMNRAPQATSEITDAHTEADLGHAAIDGFMSGMNRAWNIAAKMWPRGSAHTYASENADRYRALEDASAAIAKAIEAEMLHASDCAIYNEPAFPKGECDCGASAPQPSREEMLAALRNLGDYVLKFINPVTSSDPHATKMLYLALRARAVIAKADNAGKP